MFNKSNLVTKSNKKGFTLAEVLITLAIVGIIAAISLPSLVINAEKQGYVNGLKKFVATFQNGMKTYMASKECNDVACTGAFDGAYNNSTWNDNIETLVKSTFNVLKVCKNGDSTCKTATYKRINGVDPANDSNVGTAYFNKGFTFLTTDGMAVQILDMNNGNCDATSSYVSVMNPYCTDIFVDINGAKGPNIEGRDLFLFYLGNNGLIYPCGGLEQTKFSTNSYGPSGSFWRDAGKDWCGKTTTTIDSTWQGYGCSARIIEQGWQMNY